MSIWLEIHCDDRRDGAGSNFRAVCATNNGSTFGVLAPNASAMRYALLTIERDAIAAGWVRKRGKWTCPGCAKASPNTRIEPGRYE